MIARLSLGILLGILPTVSAQTMDSVLTEPAPGIRPTGEAGRYTINFKNATVDTLLDELSRVFGFSIVKISPVGNERVASIVNLQGLSQADAVTLINSALNSLGFSAIQKGNVLQIHRRSEAMTKDIPVRRFSRPDEVPQTEELMTAVIPLRSVNATQLAQQLRPLIDPAAMISADASSNALIVTDVTSTIHRVVSIVAELDAHVAEATQVRVIPLKRSNAPELSRMINELFRQRQIETAARGNVAGPPAQLGARRGGRGG